MSFHNILYVVPSSPLFSIIIWLVLLVAALYLARPAAHHAIRALSLVLHSACRLTAHAAMRAEHKLAVRNKEVLLAAGREAAERVVEREFDRIDASVRRDLAEYPALQRELSEAVNGIERDYQDSAEVPPEPPAWAKVVESVAEIAPREPVVAEVLEDIHQSMVRGQRDALAQYRSDNNKRHRILHSMMPLWRKVARVVAGMDGRVTRLLERSTSIDRHMAHYEEVVRASSRAERMLSSSSLTQFFIAGFVLSIAVGGAAINFHLISRPMEEMVGGNSYIMGYKVANIAALVIILVEATLGLFMMESLRITRLFPVIGALDDRMRVKMIWATVVMLVLLASIESGLAFMREKLSQDDAALLASLMSNHATIKSAATASAVASSQWITTAAQMGMGFILPFVLTFVAIPLESFVHSSRTVLGLLGQGVLRTLAFIMRLCGNISRYGGAMLIRLYDLLIFLPLWIEERMKGRKEGEVAVTPGAATEGRS